MSFARRVMLAFLQGFAKNFLIRGSKGYSQYFKLFLTHTRRGFPLTVVFNIPIISAHD